MPDQETTPETPSAVPIESDEVSKPEVCETCGRGAQYGGPCSSGFHLCRACTWWNGERISVCEGCQELEQQVFEEPPPPEPVPMILYCPKCHFKHVDVGEFAQKVHHTHACQGPKCGLVWRPAIVPTVGVEYLPGYKNESS